MREYTTETYNVVHELVLNITENSVTDTRVEECHGYHTFYDINSQHIVNSAWIKIGDTYIDITDRLTDAEKELLTENQEQ